MSQKDEQVDAAFITGHASFQPSAEIRHIPTQITITATSGGESAVHQSKSQQEVENGGEYCLVVNPGRATVEAMADGVRSEKIEVEVGAGDVTIVNFRFGKRDKP